MYKKQIELITRILYKENSFGTQNTLFSSLQRLFELFWVKHKKELYLVGGCVRDLLLGREPKDYDLCTNATPEEVKEICKKEIDLPTFDSGIKHGTITIIDKFFHQQYEITTYRTESEYLDHRHPCKVDFVSNLEEDLKRRDFTINSFAYNLLTNEVLMLDESYLNDLDLRIIRTVGDANKRFEEDALRMLRAIRFSAQLNFSIAKDTFEAICLDCDWMMYISKERIRDELTKILLSDNPQRLELFYLTGLEKHSFDGYYRPVEEMISCKHDNPWHYTDVFHHTMDVVKSLPTVFELRWAAFFHDLGKKRVKKLKEGTTDHYRYIGHQEESAKMCLDIMDILKFSNDQKDLIYKYVLYHDQELVTCKKATFKKILVDIGKDHFKDFIKLREADANAHRLTKDTKYAIDYIDKIKERYLEATINDDALTVRDLKINGYDLMERGIFNKELGDTLKYLLEKVLEEPSLNEKNKLIELASDYIMNKRKE